MATATMMALTSFMAAADVEAGGHRHDKTVEAAAEHDAQHTARTIVRLPTSVSPMMRKPAR